MGKIQKIERLFYIIKYLTNHETVTAEELAEICKTSVRNIYRDMKELEKVGFYYTVEGKNGYKLIQQPLNYPHHLTFNEWTALILFPLLTNNVVLREHPFYHLYQSAIEKISKNCKRYKQHILDPSALGDRILFQSHFTESFHPEIMSFMIESLINNKSIQITYYSIYRDTMTDRTIDPYFLVPRGGHLYIVAYCHYRENIRIFRLNRIKSIKILEQTFNIPNEFDIMNFLENRWSIFADDEETTNFVVKFDKEVARYIYEYDFYADTQLKEQKDGSLLLKTTVKSKNEFITWIRSYGLKAEIIEPSDVRDQLREEYELLAKKYKNI